MQIAIDPATPGSERTFLRDGAKFLYELRPGDDWAPHPAGGVIITSPMLAPMWVHEVEGVIVRELIRPAF